MPGGFMGKYCIVDLTEETTETIEPGEAFYRKYLSGYGIGAAVIAERQAPGIDPLSPESHLGFCSGLLTGSKALFSGRFMVVGKSPLTGGWGDSNGGGFFSRELKRSGFDAVFFTGAAKKPVWVDIGQDRILINDASSLWGKDTVETEAAIREALGSRRVQVASIGTSGEKRSFISGIVTDGGRIAARSGLGALMGSKRLKAISAHGNRKITVARPKALTAINRGFMERFQKSCFLDRATSRHSDALSIIIGRTGISFPLKSSLVRELYKKYGTPGMTVYCAMAGDMPIKNWQGVGYLDYGLQKAKKTSGGKVLKYQKRRYACQGCPLGCGGIIDIPAGRYRDTPGYKPEYETVAAFGGLLLQDDLEAIIELNEMCNRAGIDTISTGACIAFAIECFENGLIDKEMTGGLELGWGRSEEIVRLTEMIIHREGLGDMLADGTKRAAMKIGSQSERFAMHAGGQELPMWDSRRDAGLAIAYQCEPTPGRHSISSYLYASLFGVEAKFPKARLMVEHSIGRLAKKVSRYTAGSFYMQLVNCAGLCLFGALTSPLPVVEYLNAVTGWDLSPDEYLETGERILSLRKAFSVREGIRPEGQALVPRAAGRPALARGPSRGISVDLKGLQDEFFRIAGWDAITGGPTKEKMRELGIDSLF